MTAPTPGRTASGPAVGAAPAARPPVRSRTVLAAAHVVADPYADTTPDGPAALDWDATLAFRHHLWSHGLGVAEAMDTAQRGMGLDWAVAAELIRRSGAEARAAGGRLVCGAGTDQLTGGSLAEIRAAYEEQLAVVEDAGAQAVLMASRALAAAARGPEDYLDLYGHLLRQAAQPVVLHWLGPMFDPALAGYWGSADLDAATDTLLAVVAAHPGKVDGVKVSLLDARRETALRRRLPPGVRCYTGDDFHYPELIAGDDRGFSHALLGVFDPLAPLAAEAVRRLDTGDPAAFRQLLDPTVGLARHLFQAPTRYYKTGVVLLAWLAGHQSHFTMVGGLQSARSLPHLHRAHELAAGLGLFPDPDLAVHRMRRLLSVYGAADAFPLPGTAKKAPRERATERSPRMTGNLTGPTVPTSPTSLSRLSLNQETLRQWSLPELADGCVRAGIPAVGLWRAPVQAYGVAAAARLVRAAGLRVSSLCRGGFLTALDPGERAAALDDNRAAVDEAATLGTDTLVLVSGGLPAGSRDLPGARERIADAVGELAPYAAERGVRLAIEPLHPMYAADRCVVSTLAQALDLAERFPADRVGVVVDTYHLWWDDTAGAQIDRAGAAARLAAFQLADWVTPLPEGVLLGRGQLGDGVVGLRWFRERVEAAGYRGPIEVEIFNPALWARDGTEVLAEIVDRFRRHVAARPESAPEAPGERNSYKG